MIRFDYSQVDWTFVARIMTENNRRLSRTYQGKSDTGTSAQKLPLRLSAQALRDQIEKNEREVHKFVHAQWNAEQPRCAADLKNVLFQIADLTNEHLLPDGRFRKWPVEANQRSLNSNKIISGPTAKVAPKQLDVGVAEFVDIVWQRWSEIGRDPVPLAAWAEWELNGGSLHPFYDGCGRISRAFASTILVRENCLLPLFENGARYFEMGNRGPDAWVDYYRNRIQESGSWIPLQTSVAVQCDLTP